MSGLIGGTYVGTTTSRAARWLRHRLETVPLTVGRFHAFKGTLSTVPVNIYR